MRAPFQLEAETGPNGNVTGSFHFHAAGEHPWAYDPERDREEFIEFHEVTVDGKITSGKADMGYVAWDMMAKGRKGGFT